MRRKMTEDVKRSKIIGIKVQVKTKEQLDYIAKREGTTLSTVTNDILVKYIEDYFKIAKIEWDKLPPEERRRGND